VVYWGIASFPIYPVLILKSFGGCLTWEDPGSEMNPWEPDACRLGHGIDNWL